MTTRHHRARTPEEREALRALGLAQSAEGWRDTPKGLGPFQRPAFRQMEHDPIGTVRTLTFKPYGALVLRDVVYVCAAATRLADVGSGGCLRSCGA